MEMIKCWCMKLHFIKLCSNLQQIYYASVLEFSESKIATLEYLIMTFYELMAEEKNISAYIYFSICI